MKKFKNPKLRICILLFLITILVLCTIMHKKELTMQNWTYKSDYKEIEVEKLESVVSEDESYIIVEWTNNTEKIIHYGQQFQLYKEVDGKWNECSVIKDDAIWLSLLYEIEPKSKNNVTYDLNLFDILKEGNYRLEQKYYFAEDNTKLYSLDFYFQLDFK